MTKEQVIKGAVKLIEQEAHKYDLEVSNLGVGHGFGNSFWENVLSDTSEIPTITAYREGYSIKIRPFWSSPEIDIRRQTPVGEELLIFNYSDMVKGPDDKEYVHTGDYVVHEVRVDGARGNYMSLINEVYEYIHRLEKFAKEEM